MIHNLFINQFKPTISCLHKPDEETTFILCAFICGQKALSIWFMTAFSHTANNWVHYTLANSAVHLTGNLCTLLTLKNLPMLGMLLCTNSRQEICNTNNQWGKSNTWCWQSIHILKSLTYFPSCHLNSVANNSFTAAILTLTAVLMLLPYCSLQKSFLFLYMLFSFSTYSLLQNPVDHSAVVAVSANQLLQENWLRENLIQLWRH